MGKFILILLSLIAVALIITGIVIETVPTEQLQIAKTTDPISCSCKMPSDEYDLIAKGIITDIRYTPILNSAGKLHHTDITFFVDDKQMTLDYDRTHADSSPYGFYSEIYGADANGNIETNKYYYIYNYGNRIIWSQTPKGKE